MNKKPNIIKVTLCGPSDVSEEIKIAREVIAEWNHENFDSTGWGIKDQHWNTDAIPTMAERGQAAINHQLIDESGIVVAIFWRRLGTPTGLAGSGTEEEITRAYHREIPVLAYFSNLEAPASRHDKDQADKLAAFRMRMMNTGLPFTFSSRRELRKLFKDQLKATAEKIMRDAKKVATPRKPGKAITQKAAGNDNIQIAGDGNTFNYKATMSKKPKVIIERLPDHIGSEEQKQVKDWIEDLVEASAGKTRTALFAEWRVRFYNRFKVTSIPELKVGQMKDVEAWHRQQLNLIKAGRRTSDPQSWRDAKYASIKGRMRKMGLVEEEYYPALSDRLNRKKPFTSLKQLSKHDLERVERCVKYDYEKW